MTSAFTVQQYDGENWEEIDADSCKKIPVGLFCKGVFFHKLKYNNSILFLGQRSRRMKFCTEENSKSPTGNSMGLHIKERGCWTEILKNNLRVNRRSFVGVAWNCFQTALNNIHPHNDYSKTIKTHFSAQYH